MKFAFAVCALCIFSLQGCEKSNPQNQLSAVSAPPSGRVETADDPLYAEAVMVASRLLPQCRMVGDALISMARPRANNDWARRRQVENTISHIPDGCIKNED